MCGWEAGVDQNPGRYAGTDGWQDCFRSAALPTVLSAGQRSGKYVVRWPTGENAYGFYGDYVARSQDWMFYCIGVLVEQFSGTPTVGAVYILARGAHTPSNPGYTHVGIGLGVNAVGPPVQVTFQIIKFNADGSYNSTQGATTVFTLPMGSWHWVVLACRASTLETRLYVDGVQDATTTALSGTPFDSRLSPASGFVGGKGSDSGLSMKFDDFCTCDGADWTDLPPTNTAVILHQPNQDVTPNQWTPSPGQGSHFRNWDDENDDLADYQSADCLTPTGAGTREFMNVVDKNAAGTVEGCRTVFDVNKNYPHRVYGKTSGGSWIDLGLGVPNSGAPTGDNWVWAGRQMATTPEAAAWTNILFDQLQVGLEQGGAVVECYALSVMAVGPGLTMPTANPPVQKAAQPGYLDGLEALGGTKSAYVQALQALSAIHAAYLEASAGEVVVGSLAAYLAGIEPLAGIVSAYLRALEALSAIHQAYLVGAESATGIQAAYLDGLEALGVAQAAYLDALEAVSGIQAAYLGGLESVGETKPAYLDGLEAMTGIGQAYLQGLEAITAVLGSFISSAETFTGQQTAFIHALEPKQELLQAFLSAGQLLVLPSAYAMIILELLVAYGSAPGLPYAGAEIVVPLTAYAGIVPSLFASARHGEGLFGQASIDVLQEGLAVLTSTKYGPSALLSPWLPALAIIPNPTSGHATSPCNQGAMAELEAIRVASARMEN